MGLSEFDIFGKQKAAQEYVKERAAQLSELQTTELLAYIAALLEVPIFAEIQAVQIELRALRNEVAALTRRLDNNISITGNVGVHNDEETGPLKVRVER